MSSLFDEADAIADVMRTRAGFSESDLATMFSALCRRSVAPSEERLREAVERIMIGA